MSARDIANTVGLQLETLTEQRGRWTAVYIPPDDLCKLKAYTTYANWIRKAGGRMIRFGVDVRLQVIEIVFMIDEDRE